MSVRPVPLLLSICLLAACSKKEAAPASGSASSSRPAGTHEFHFHIVEPSGTSDLVVTKPVIRIGRLPSHEVRLADAAVGRTAAMIEVDQRGVTYQDMGAGSNLDGVWLLGKNAPLTSGAVIEVGNTKITVEF